MSIKNDRWIREMARAGMISPFEEGQVREGVISYGVSSYGYDLRVGDEYKIFTNINNVIVDPKQFEPKSFIDYKGEYCIIPPNSFALAKSVEYFKMRDWHRFFSLKQVKFVKQAMRIKKANTRVREVLPYQGFSPDLL
jgi:deoxycytidine triphosphate deaminase